MLGDRESVNGNSHTLNNSILSRRKEADHWSSQSEQKLPRNSLFGLIRERLKFCTRNLNQFQNRMTKWTELQIPEQMVYGRKNIKWNRIIFFLPYLILYLWLHYITNEQGSLQHKRWNTSSPIGTMALHWILLSRRSHSIYDLYFIKLVLLIILRWQKYEHTNPCTRSVSSD